MWTSKMFADNDMSYEESKTIISREWKEWEAALTRMVRKLSEWAIIGD